MPPVRPIESLPSIASLAMDVEWVERGDPYPDGEVLSLGPGFADPAILAPDIAALFSHCWGTEPMRICRMRDVALDASLMALFHGDLPILETLYLCDAADYAYALVKPRPLVETDAETHHIIGCNRAYHSYYHWVIQALPAIDWGLQTRSRDRLTLALPKLKPWQEETLALLGYADVPRLTLDGTHERTWRIDLDVVARRLDSIRAHRAANPPVPR